MTRLEKAVSIIAKNFEQYRDDYEDAETVGDIFKIFWYGTSDIKEECAYIFDNSEEARQLGIYLDEEDFCLIDNNGVICDFRTFSRAVRKSSI